MFTRSAVDTTAQSAKVGDMTNVSSLPEVPDARRRIARAVKAHLVVADITPTRMAATPPENSEWPPARLA